MMSNSNYSIGLQRLKPVHTTYCGLHNLAENWSWARNANDRDRFETETSRPRPQPWQNIIAYAWLTSVTDGQPTDEHALRCKMPRFTKFGGQRLGYWLVSYD